MPRAADLALPPPGVKTGPASGKPLDLEVEVRHLARNATQSFGEARWGIGDVATVRTVEAGSEIDIVLTTVRNQGTGTDLFTANGVTKPVVLEAVLNQVGEHPMEQKPWAGFSATTTLLRSDYNLGAFAPFIADEVAVAISIEAMKAE